MACYIVHMPGQVLKVYTIYYISTKDIAALFVLRTKNEVTETTRHGRSDGDDGSLLWVSSTCR